MCVILVYVVHYKAPKTPCTVGTVYPYALPPDLYVHTPLFCKSVMSMVLQLRQPYEHLGFFLSCENPIRATTAGYWGREAAYDSEILSVFRPFHPENSSTTSDRAPGAVGNPTTLPPSYRLSCAYHSSNGATGTQAYALLLCRFRGRGIFSSSRRGSSLPSPPWSGR